MSHLFDLMVMARDRNGSELHLIVGLPPAIRCHGRIVSLPAPALTPSDLEMIVATTFDDSQRNRLRDDRRLCAAVRDCQGRRARIAAYYHSGAVELAIRLGATDVGDAQVLGLSPVVTELARLKHGLVIIAGATDAGKTTTLNYLIDVINRERCCKVITIEDPVEYVHQPQRSLIVQQEIPGDANCFPEAVAHVLRQSPDVIVIGEMREPETIASALTAAETGHLVLTTLHTSSAPQTIDRIMGVFPPEQQRQIVFQLAAALQAVVVQDLIPRVDGRGRALACEILVANAGVRNLIRSRRMHLMGHAMSTGRRDGMQTMEMSLLALYDAAVIGYEDVQSRLFEPHLVAMDRSSPMPTQRPVLHLVPPVVARG